MGHKKVIQSCYTSNLVVCQEKIFKRQKQKIEKGVTLIDPVISRKKQIEERRSNRCTQVHITPYPDDTNLWRPFAVIQPFSENY